MSKPSLVLVLVAVAVVATAVVDVHATTQVAYSLDANLKGTSIKAKFSLSSSSFVPLSWRCDL